MDSETFEVLGRWEVDRRRQTLAYDAWWHLGYDTLVTSEWGTPNTVKTALSLRFCSARTTDGVCIFGICTSVSMCRKSILAPSISSCSSSGRRTTRPSLRLRQCRDQPQGFVGLDLDLVSTHQVRLEGGDCSSNSYCYP